MQDESEMERQLTSKLSWFWKSACIYEILACVRKLTFPGSRYIRLKVLVHMMDLASDWTALISTCNAGV